LQGKFNFELDFPIYYLGSYINSLKIMITIISNTTNNRPKN